MRLLAASLAILALLAADTPPPSDVLVLSGGHYLDVRAGAIRPNGAIVLREGRIAALYPPGKEPPAPGGARVIRLEGRTILPGLIDAHVHLTLAGDPAANAAATLRAGFTTVADLGSAQGAGIRLRDSIAKGLVSGPRIVAAGSWIGAKGGVCEFGGATVGNVEEARTRALEDLKAGADLLKVCVTGWPAEALAHPDSVQFGGPMLATVLDVAAAAGRPVYAHAIGQAGALLAGRSGVRALAHTPIVDSAGAVRLRDSRLRVISTLATLTAGDTGGRVLASFRLLRKAGVPVVLGTDAGVLKHGANARELLALADAGLSPLEVLRAATTDAAALLGVEGVGEIAPGAAADLVVVEGNPLVDLRTMTRPVLVVRGGRIILPTAG